MEQRKPYGFGVKWWLINNNVICILAEFLFLFLAISLNF